MLAIAGEHDLGTPVAAARRIAATAPQGELVVIEGVGHFPFAERPEEYWSVVRGWLDERQLRLGREAVRTLRRATSAGVGRPRRLSSPRRSNPDPYPAAVAVRRRRTLNA